MVGNNDKLGVNKGKASAAAKKPVPVLKVYTTDPAGFRDLVQELTGKDSVDPPSSSSAGASGKKPAGGVAGGRLQRIAPPPLGHVPDNGGMGLSIELSPVPTFTPADWSACWSESVAAAANQSPSTLAYMSMAHQLLNNNNNNNHSSSSSNENDSSGHASSSAALLLPLSPTYCGRPAGAATEEPENTAVPPASLPLPPLSPTWAWNWPWQTTTTQRSSPRCGGDVSPSASLSPLFGLPSPNAFAGFGMETS